jgi:hypothetical protein
MKNCIKKFNISALFVFMLFLMACPNDADIKESAGLGKYFINNQSEVVLYYGTGSAAIEIGTGQTVQIHEDGGIGIQAPLPSDGLGGRLLLYKDTSGNIGLLINPIDNSIWIKERQDDQYYGLVHYTLIVTSNMLN